MSQPHYAKPLLTTQLPTTCRYNSPHDSSLLYFRTNRVWDLSLPRWWQFAVQSLEAQIPSAQTSEASIPSVQNSAAQISVIGSKEQILLPRGRALTALKWIFNRCGIRALLNRGLSIATGPKPEDPEPEDPEPEDPETEDPEPENTLLPFESAYVHNCTSSSFHNLPMELILAIACYLSPVACLIMQRVCSRFRTGLAPHGIAPELESNEVTEKEFFQFTFLLRRDVQLRLQDEYDRECSLAPLNSTLHRFGCSGCRTIHTIGDFSAKQLSSSPKTRICKGLEASFQLCSHLSFSGQCLLRGLREMKNAELLCCSTGHRWDIHGEWMLCTGGPIRGPSVGFHGGHTVTIDQSIPVFQIGKNEITTHEPLSFALRGMSAYICPHLNSNSPELFNGRPITAECPDYTFSEIQQDGYSSPCCFSNIASPLRLGECVTWSQCPDPDCFTRYCLARICWPSGHNIVLQVSRDLFGCPTHPPWQAQMERKRAKTKTEGNEKSKTEIMKSEKDQLKRERFKCSAYSKKCKGECVLARYISFMNS